MHQFGEFFFNHWDLFAALAIILAMLVFQTFGARLRGYKEIDPQGAVHLINQQDALLVDVREDREYRDGFIVGSQHIPLGKFGSRTDELEPYRDKPVIVGCRSGSRSATACAMLRKKGFGDVYNLRGGIMAWQSAGLPLSKEGGKRKKKR